MCVQAIVEIGVALKFIRGLKLIRCTDEAQDEISLRANERLMKLKCSYEKIHISRFIYMQ